MELQDWNIILDVNWMFQFNPITFDLYQLNIILHNQGDFVELHGKIETPAMNLIRRKDLQEFKQHKSRCLTTLSMANNSFSI